MLFLLGVEKRCGTNFLFDLLRRHPDIEMRPPIWEDYLLQRIAPLVDFATGTTQLWKDWWQFDDREAGRFLEYLGDAIERFVVADSTARYVLMKTPTASNVDLAPAVFPRSPVVLLVRDGRAVCESALRSFDRDVAETTRRWVENGRRIRDFLSRPSARPALLVRYEDLVVAPERELRRLFDGLGLDPECYDYAGVDALPVRGSSSLRDGSGTLHWEPVEKPVGFDPLCRHHGWDLEAVAAFERTAGDVLEFFGYPAAVSAS